MATDEELADAREHFVQAQAEVERLKMILDQACDEIDLLRRYLVASMPPRAVLQAIRLHLDRPAPTAGYSSSRRRRRGGSVLGWIRATPSRCSPTESARHPRPRRALPKRRRSSTARAQRRRQGSRTR